MLNQFSNLSCYEEFEIQYTLLGISKIDLLKEIGNRVDEYYFFVSNDGIFNWFDLEGNHIKNPCILKTIICDYIPLNITKCIIPDNVVCIGYSAFIYSSSLTSITIPNSVISIGSKAFMFCKSLTSITIPNNVKNIGSWAFYECNSLKEVVFKGKSLNEIKRMMYYPFGLEDESIIKCEI